MDRMAIIAKTHKRHEGKSERGGCNNLPPLLRERVNRICLFCFCADPTITIRENLYETV